MEGWGIGWEWGGMGRNGRVWEGISMEARESHSLEGSIGRSTCTLSTLSTDDRAKAGLKV